MITRVVDWWFSPVSHRRVAALSIVAHAMVLYTVFWNERWAAAHAGAPRSFYQPMLLARVFHLPAPTPTTMLVLQISLAAAACIAAVGTFRGRPSRWSNGIVALGYTIWLIWAFSFSKVDHDRLTIIVFLWLVVFVPGRPSDGEDLCGWVIRTIQGVFVLAYPLSAVSKIRKSGWGWASQATFSRAIIRRGTAVGNLLVNHRSTLVLGQWLFIFFEATAISALWLTGRAQRFILWGILGLHVFTWIVIGIHFVPHTIFLLSFVPLERLWREPEAERSTPQLGVR